MTIQQLIAGVSVNWIHVNVLEQLSPTRYIVADDTGYAVMDIPSDSNHDKYIEIGGGHIDHAYWRDKTGVWKEPKLERYSPYYSDHDALCITLEQNVSFHCHGFLPFFIFIVSGTVTK